jgi:hypothetical protein
MMLCLTENDRSALFEINIPALLDAAGKADQIFVCWGGVAWDDEWIGMVTTMIIAAAQPPQAIWCWGTTKAGAPKHPLARGLHRISVAQQPEVWEFRPVL